MRFLNAGPGRHLVNKSARFSLDCTFAILKIDAATASLTQRYVMELCFFFSVELGIVALITTELLSQNTLAALSNGMPNIHNL